MPSVPQSGEEDMEQEAGGDRGQEGGVEGQAARLEEEEVAGGEQEGWMREEQEGGEEAVFAGVRNMARDRLRDLPKDGRTGEW